MKGGVAGLVLFFVGFWLVFIWGGLFGVVGDFVWVFLLLWYLVVWGFFL